MEQKKIIIIGGGPAGLSAAIYNARAGLKPVVFAGSPPGGQLMLTTEVENYPGYKDILGPELVETFRKQALAFGTEIIDSNITSVDFIKNPFVLGYSGKTISSDAVIIATGAKALWLGLESETRLRGRGVSACATCDGFFFKNKVVAVVGGGDTALEEAQTLTKFAKKVYIIHRRGEFRASKIMQDRITSNDMVEIIFNNEVIEVLGDQKVEGIKLGSPYKNSNEIQLDGLFIAIGHKPDTELFKDHIMLDKKGYIVTSQMIALEGMKNLVEKKDVSVSSYEAFDFEFQTMTNIPGVFAGGDCVDHVYRQASTAAGLGVSAGLDAERWLLDRA